MHDMISKIVLRNAIATRYSLNVADVNIDSPFGNSRNSWLGTPGEIRDLAVVDEPIFWFRTNDIKYVMKEQLQITFDMFTPEFGKSIGDGYVFDSAKYQARLVRFWKEDNNKFPTIFPKFLGETDDFYLFDYVPGTTIPNTKEAFTGEVLEQYIAKNREVITTLTDWRPINTPQENWIIHNGNIMYVNVRQFVHSTEPSISIQFDDDVTQLSNKFVNGVECVAYK